MSDAAYLPPAPGKLSGPDLRVRQPDFTGWIGAAREDITPPAGIYARNWGAAEHETALGVHRPLTLTALTLAAGPDEPPLALIAADLGWWRTLEDEIYVRGGALEALGGDSARVMINLSHTHSGPSICRLDISMPGGELVGEYVDRLRAAASAAVAHAMQTAAQATLSLRYGRCALARSRDLPDPAADRRLCGLDPSVPADDTLLVGRVTDAAGGRVATVINYASHPTTLSWRNRLISPDFPGAAREIVERATGGAPCLFLQGASGELAPEAQYMDDPAETDAAGRELGYAALSVLEGLGRPGTELAFKGVVESGAPLAIWERRARTAGCEVAAAEAHVVLDLQSMTHAAELEAALAAAGDRATAERIRRKLRIRRAVGDGDTWSCPFWVWRAGDALFVGSPNECYSELQTALRARFPHHAVCVMNIVNGHLGYLPPALLYDEDVYPVWQTPFARGSLERFICAAEEAASRLLTAR